MGFSTGNGKPIKVRLAIHRGSILF